MKGGLSLIITPQKIKVKWHGTNKKHFISKGYSGFTLGKEFEVEVTELPLAARTLVSARCDYCGIKYDKKLVLFKLDGDFNRKTFCSKECNYKYLKINNSKINPNPPVEKILVYCDYCGEEKFILPSVAKKNKYHFCNRICYSSFRSENFKGEYMYNYNSITGNCDNCGKEMIIPKFDSERNSHNFCCNECYYEFRSKFYVGENHHLYGTKIEDPERIEKMRLIAIDRHKKGDFPQTDTSIHKEISNYLDLKQIKFTNEFKAKYYSIDIYLNEYNLMIEIMGDYWHANPLKYKRYEDTNDIQKKDITRDKSKHTYIKKYYSIEILYLWETDIKNNFDTCIDLINLYIKNNGILKDYQSFNYEFENNKLMLKNEILKPYFLT